MTVNEQRLMKLREVLEVCAVARSSLYEMVARGDFPSPVRVSTRAVAWRHDEVLAWIRSRPRVKPPSERVSGLEDK